MLDEALMALAGAGGAAVVTAMATDAWSATRTGVVRMFRRAGNKQDVEAVLDKDAHAVADALDTDRELVRQELAPVWAARLTTVLAGCPDRLRDEVAVCLDDLINAVDSARPGGTGVQSVNASWAGRDINQAGSVGGNFSTGSSGCG